MLGGCMVAGDGQLETTGGNGYARDYDETIRFRDRPTSPPGPLMLEKFTRTSRKHTAITHSCNAAGHLPLSSME
ncbi:unnamed protein product [Angiostrongylus costaricensis]|uniref:Uncharacterized protein n=1 Tax=Angiostrongylus costaricensis TaxID=334426 RepID=A0A0R3PW43_ANGCS|nr:unnamed protein product [Angiostrongylus costaricensis]